MEFWWRRWRIVHGDKYVDIYKAWLGLANKGLSVPPSPASLGEVPEIIL